MKLQLNNYSYNLLRYVHDITTGEFINVGLILFCKDQKFFGAHFLTSVKRVTSAFPGSNGHKLRSQLISLEKDFENYYSSKLGQLPFVNYEVAIDIARKVLPLDHSSLQWSENKTGRCIDASEELNRMFDRFVGLYKEDHVRKRINDKDIWKSFSSRLKARNLDHYFTSTTISTEDDEHEFNHAWKNGKWHCIQPLSFDYSSSEHIKEKAHKWLGQVHSLSTSQNQFKLYFLIGKPSNQKLSEAYSNAKSILDKMPGDYLLFEENQENDLLNLLEDEVKTHLSHQH